MENEKEPQLAKEDSFKLDLYYWLQALVFALVTLILLFTFLGRVIGVDGESMLPTLKNRDLLLLQSVGYTPEQGDIVVLTKPFGDVTQPIVKRVIATGGQTVDINYEAGTVSVDGELLDEPYINETMRWPASQWETITHVTVPEGSIFVMGDNRNHSSDSRDERLGTIDERYVLGRVLFTLLPGKFLGGEKDLGPS